MVKKKKRTNKVKLNNDLYKEKGINSIRTISKSNSKKIRVKKKYRKEKGTRDELWCSNPHSYEDNSSRFSRTFSEIEKDKTKTNKTITSLTLTINVIRVI